MGQEFESLNTHHMVNVVQLVERQFVALVVVGSSPVFRSNMRVSYIGNTPAFQAGKVGSIPTTRSKKVFEKKLDIIKEVF